MVNRETITIVIDKLFNEKGYELIKHNITTTDKCKYESFTYTNSKGETITLKVREVKKPMTFQKYLHNAKLSVDPKDAWRVEEVPDDEVDDNYKNTKMFVSAHGSTVAIRNNGDIISVCAYKENGKSLDSTSALLSFAVKNGGDRLDSFDGNHWFYRHMGFEPVSHIDFVEDFAPPGWVKGRDKAEPIIFYRHTGFKTDMVTPQDVYDNIPRTTGDNAYGDAELIRDNFIIANEKRIKRRITMKKKEYPLSYEEFEKRVIELCLEQYTGNNPNDFLDFIDSLKYEDKNDNEMLNLYKDSCYRYDAYGKDAFDDENLIGQPVRLLYMAYTE